MKVIEKLVRATGLNLVPRRKVRPIDVPSGEASDWIRRMIIVRGQKQKN